MQSPPPPSGAVSPPLFIGGPERGREGGLVALSLSLSLTGNCAVGNFQWKASAKTLLSSSFAACYTEADIDVDIQSSRKSNTCMCQVYF